jgi:hypothetical protein
MQRYTKSYHKTIFSKNNLQMSIFGSCLFSENTFSFLVMPNREIVTELSLSYEECDRAKPINIQGK